MDAPRLNEPAPEFEARTTQGIRRLGDYKGKWLVFFSHPSDFTPVCATEFVSFAKKFDEFQKLGCELLGLSVDSVFSHLAWARNIKEKFGVEIPFAIIADPLMHVASKYGIAQSGASFPARALFIIDDKGVLRAMLYYPVSNGRSVDEVLRLVAALQASDHYGVSTPEGWRPGEKVIVPAPLTDDEIREQLDSGYECLDWYFCRRDLKKAS